MKKLFIISSILTLLLVGPAYASTQTKVHINGLVCDFCARALEKVFSKQAAVEGIDVNLDSKIVLINFKDGQTLPEETIRRLIQDAGYNVEGFENANQ